MTNQEVKQTEVFLGTLLKEMFLLPLKFDDWTHVEFFTDMLMQEYQQAYTALTQKMEEEGYEYEECEIA